MSTIVTEAAAGVIEVDDVEEDVERFCGAADVGVAVIEAGIELAEDLLRSAAMSEERKLLSVRSARSARSNRSALSNRSARSLLSRSRSRSLSRSRSRSR